MVLTSWNKLWFSMVCFKMSNIRTWHCEIWRLSTNFKMSSKESFPFWIPSLNSEVIFSIKLKKLYIMKYLRNCSIVLNLNLYSLGRVSYRERRKACCYLSNKRFWIFSFFPKTLLFDTFLTSLFFSFVGWAGSKWSWFCFPRKDNLRTTKNTV